MKAVSDGIVTFLESQASFTDVMQQRVFPIVANEQTPFPFTTYRIIVSEGESKDADKATVVLSLWYKHDQYTECVTFSDTVEQLIKEKFNWVSTEVDFIEENLSFVSNINFEITQ